MPRTLTLRNVPEPVIRALRERARQNRRSLPKEALSILQGIVLDRASLKDQLTQLRSRLDARMTLDEIHSAIGQVRPAGSSQ